MRHLMNPLDFSVEELDRLFETARDIEGNMPKYAMPVKVKSWPPAFTNQHPDQAQL